MYEVTILKKDYKNEEEYKKALQEYYALIEKRGHKVVSGAPVEHVHIVNLGYKLTVEE